MVCAEPAALCAADTLRPRTILGEYGPTADEPLVSIRSNCSAVAAGEMFRTPYASNVAFHDAPSKATGSKADTCQWTNVAANRAWLSAVEATDAAFKMSCYYGRVYPGIATGARVNASQLDYFWSHVPTLGATSVILTDKTGTLTENRLTVTHFVLASGVVEVGGELDASPGPLREALELGAADRRLQVGHPVVEADPVVVVVGAHARGGGEVTHERDELRVVS